MNGHARHAHIMHGHVIHGHVMHAHIMHDHVMHANAMHCMLYVRINSDMLTVAKRPKLVYQWHANSNVPRSVLQRKLACR